MGVCRLRRIDPRLNEKKFVLIKCPKCGQSRGGEAKHKSWKCFRCGYTMNRKNTKIQGRPDNPVEAMHILRLLKEDKI